MDVFSHTGVDCQRVQAPPTATVLRYGAKALIPSAFPRDIRRNEPCVHLQL